MAFQQKDLSFSNFIKEFFEAPQKLPSHFYREVFALYKRQRKTILTSVSIDAPEGAASTASVLSTYVAGGEEALLDVKGINTRVNLEDLIKNPLGTIKALGKTTFDDITKLDELAGDRRSDVIEGLTAGDLYVGDRDLTEPSNLTVQALKKLGLSVVDKSELVRTVVGGQTESAIRLLGTHGISSPQQYTSDEKEDRQILEQNKNRGANYKAYKALAGSLTGLAGYMESPRPRGEYYKESLTAYNRAVASELGINLEEVLPIKTGRTYEAQEKKFKPKPPTKGTFKDTLLDQANNGFTNIDTALDDLLNDETKLRRALGLVANTPYNNRIWANLDDQSKAFARDFLRSEFVNQEFYQELKLAPDGKTSFDLYIESNPLFANMVRTKYPHPSKGTDASALQKGIITRETQRRALEAQIQMQLAEPVIRSKIAEAAGILSERRELDQLEDRLNLGRNTITDVSNVLVPANERTRIIAQRRDASAAALDRISSATTATNIANNLFFASTTKEMLENIEKGKFLDTVMISSKVLGLLPFTSSKWGSPAEYTQYLDKFAIGHIINGYQKTKNNILSATGLVFEESRADKLKGIARFSEKAFPGSTQPGVWIGWSREKVNGPRRGRPKLEWTQARVNPTTAEGLFGPWGLEDTLTAAWGETGQKLQEFGFPNFNQFDPENLLTDRNLTENFMANLHKAGADALGGVAPANPLENSFQQLAQFVGLDNWDSLDALDLNIGKIRGNNGALRFLERLGGGDHPGGFALDSTRRWKFITRLKKEGKDAQFLKPFAGLFNHYNRAANALYTFLYREILWGGYAGTNVLVKGVSAMLTPVRGLLQGIGFGDDVLLAGAVQKWGFVKWFNALGTKFYNLAANPRGASTLIGRLLGNTLSTTVLKSLGFLASGVGGFVTGGVGYLIAGLGEVGWAFGSKLLRGDIGGAFKAAKVKLIDKIRAINKLIAGIVLGILSCLAFPIIFIIAIVAMLAPLELSTGGGAYADVVSSKKLSVTKTASLAGNNIEYRISIKNITDTSGDPEIPPQDVTIASFVDTLNYAKSCADGGGIIDVSSNSGYGSVSLPQIGDLPKTTLAAGESIEVGPFTLFNIKSGDGTYLNSVEVVAENDSGKKAEASASTKIGEGGCTLCPAGWPTQPFTLTQGPQTYSTHKNAEALDLASNIGQAVRATHNGTAYATANTCAADDHSESCGYGNYVQVVSPMGFSTIYAHLSGFNISNGQQVNATDIIGSLGTSGNSTGPHVHYEFKNTSIQCIPGQNLRMRDVNNSSYPDSYIPRDIPNPGCVGPINCNMSVQ